MTASSDSTCGYSDDSARHPPYKARLDKDRNTIVTLRRIPVPARCATVFCTVCDGHQIQTAAFPQPRVELAGIQPAGARRSARSHQSAARTPEIFLHRRLESR